MERILYGLCGADADRHFSPHVWKIVMALKLKGLDYEFRPLPFTEIPSLEDGFSKTVPVLKDGDRLVRDSFDIALYLDEAYPQAPTLFGGEGGKGMARLIEGYVQNNIHPAITQIVVPDIYNMLEPADRVYFRHNREARLGRTLEELTTNRFADVAEFPRKLEPVRHVLKSQQWIGGDTPLFSDFIIFGALQWARVTCSIPLLKSDDPVSEWFERCLDLFDGAGRAVPAAE